MGDKDMDRMALKAVYRLMARLEKHIDLVTVTNEMMAVAAEEGYVLNKERAIAKVIKGMGL